MAVRQYIGARYVTKIYENSLDPSSAEWEQTTYEPLTLVTWQNSSYLSKKEVPASIGNPADNPTYWCLTGAYNGQILQLQNDIQRIDNTIEYLPATPEMYGAAGDGVTDDTQALTEALNDNDCLVLTGTYKITDMIRLEKNVSLIGLNAKILMYGDIDHWFQIVSTNAVVSGISFEKLDSAFTNYNRAFHFYYCDKVYVNNCSFKNFGTALHGLHCNYFHVNNVDIIDAYDNVAQYGYGVNTSSHHNFISNVSGINASDNNGRHLIYLNGDDMVSAEINKIFCKNWNHHPIEINVTNANGCDVTISDVIFDNVNIDPVGTDKKTGSIHGSDTNLANIYVNNVALKNHTSAVFDSLGYVKGSISNVTVQFATSILVNITDIFVRHSTGFKITNISAYNRNSTSLALVGCRDSSDVIFDGIYDMTPAETINYLFNIQDSTADIGCYKTSASNVVRSTGTNTITALNYYT